MTWPPLTQVWPRELYQAVLSEGLHARTVRMTMPELEWKRASSCANGNSCVEVADTPDGGVAVKDSKAGPDGPILVFTAQEWADFIAGVEAGEFKAVP